MHQAGGIKQVASSRCPCVSVAATAFATYLGAYLQVSQVFFKVKRVEINNSTNILPVRTSASAL